MNVSNIKDIMMSISDFKAQVSEVINKAMTKVIVKNNEPVSVIMPFADYLQITGDADESKNLKLSKGLGQNITLSNGVQIMVCVETDANVLSSDGYAVKIYMKMKNSNDYKLHYTLNMGNPRLEETMTSEEIMKQYLIQSEDK